MKVMSEIDGYVWEVVGGCVGTLLWFGFQLNLYPQMGQAWRHRVKNLRAQALESILEFGPWLFNQLYGLGQVT